MAAVPPKRIIPITVYMDTQAQQTTLSLFANSRDVIQFCLRYSNGDTINLETGEWPTGVTWTPVVSVIAGADLLTGSVRRAKSAVGMTVPTDNDTTGYIEMEIQAGDFLETDSTNGAWLELYLKSSDASPTYILAGLFRINVVPNPTWV